MTLTRDARLWLADSMRRVGPSGLTLLPGWNVADLAAHVVVRERRVDALPGIGGGFEPLVRHGEAVRLRYRGLPWEELLAMVEQGPPRWAPQRWVQVQPLDTALNLMEFTIHAEDIARANPELPQREVSPELGQALWKQLRLASHLLYRRCPVGVRLMRTDGPQPGDPKADSNVINAKKLPRSITGQPLESNPAHDLPLVTVRGPVLELVLHAFGRDQGSNHPQPDQLVQVSVEGNPPTLATYQAHRRGV
jgi:uncharacterized protein (TIGR03085 family)